MCARRGEGAGAYRCEVEEVRSASEPRYEDGGWPSLALCREKSRIQDKEQYAPRRKKRTARRKTASNEGMSKHFE